MLYAVIAALVVVAVCIAVPVLRRNHRLADIDRFHTARSLTTSWASAPQPPVHVPASGEQP